MAYVFCVKRDSSKRLLRVSTCPFVCVRMLEAVIFLSTKPGPAPTHSPAPPHPCSSAPSPRLRAFAWRLRWEGGLRRQAGRTLVLDQFLFLLSGCLVFSALLVCNFLWFACSLFGPSLLTGVLFDSCWLVVALSCRVAR